MGKFKTDRTRFWLAGALTGIFVASASMTKAQEPYPYPDAAYATAARQKTPPPVDLPYTEFVGAIRGKVAHDVIVHGDTAEATRGAGKITTTVPPNENIVQRLEGSDAVISAEAPSRSSNILGWIINLAPLALMAGFFLYMRTVNPKSRASQRPQRSARPITKDPGKRVTFAEVAGIEEAKEELQDIVDFLRNPYKYRNLGAKIPRGVLLSGPPGVGKTLIAKAMAGEANVPFFKIAGSDFVEMYVGVGASRVRDLFANARAEAPCIIFIDEIDAVGGKRGKGHGGNDERESTLNQMLVEMDGFDDHENVIVIAATNRPDMLDPALLRPGRFDRHVVVPNPDRNGRERILGVHMKKMPLHPDVSAPAIARGTPGFSGADLANLANEAALLATKLGGKKICMMHFEAAKDKILMGPERRSMIMTYAEKKMTAYHEGGHALVALRLPECDPVHKATIVPRGRALGMVMSLPEGDRLSMSKARAKAQLAMAMGGRVAEELIFGADQVSNGAGGDIEMATNLAYTMVTQWGMSDKIGMIKIPEGQPLDGETKAEIKSLVDEAYAHAKTLIGTDLNVLHRFAQGLLDHETLTGDQLKILVEGNLPSVRDTSEASPLPDPKAIRLTSHPDCACESKKPKASKGLGDLSPMPA